VRSTLVALDADKGINNGTPFFHAAWIGGRCAAEPIRSHPKRLKLAMVELGF